MRILSSGEKKSCNICRVCRWSQSIMCRLWHMSRHLKQWKKPSKFSTAFFFLEKLMFILEPIKHTVKSLYKFWHRKFTTVSNLSQSSNAKVKLLEAERTRSHWQLPVHTNHADETKQQLGVKEHWTLEDPCYVDVLKYINNQTFICAVEHLEGLVMQRLFKLSKANLVATEMYSHFVAAKALSWNLSLGYKMQKHISKAIAKCSSAIHTALKKYNELAPLQNPPQLTLQFNNMASYSWLSDFNLLSICAWILCKNHGGYPPTMRLHSNSFMHMRRSTTRCMNSTWRSWAEVINGHCDESLSCCGVRASLC